MRDLMDFVIYILEQMAVLFFGIELGDYSYGSFLVACIVVSVLIGSLVISFKGAGGSAGSTVRPVRKSRQHGGSGKSNGSS